MGHIPEMTTFEISFSAVTKRTTRTKWIALAFRICRPCPYPQALQSRDCRPLLPNGILAASPKQRPSPHKRQSRGAPCTSSMHLSTKQTAWIRDVLPSSACGYRISLGIYLEILVCSACRHLRGESDDRSLHSAVPALPQQRGTVRGRESDDVLGCICKTVARWRHF